MTKKKSIIGALLLITAFAVSAIAGGSSNSADFTITSGNLTAYTGTDTTVYVPDNTTTISAGAFNNTAIEVIYLPTTITTVENNAFANCSADVKIIFEIATPTSPLPSGMENWGVANAGGQITTYTTSGITTYTLSDVSAIAVGPNATYIKDGSVFDLLIETGFITAFNDYETITYTNDITVPNNAVDVSKETDGTVMMWKTGTDVYFWFDGDRLVLPEDLSYYFGTKVNGTKNIVGLEYVDTSKATIMTGMFLVSKFVNLDLSHFDTSNVTDMSWMLASGLLETVDVSSFDTSKVTNMRSMFSGLTKLDTINLSHFNTSNVTDMSYMFYASWPLETINVSNFDTTNVTNMEYMFATCPSIKTLDLSSFDMSNVTEMTSMLGGTGSASEEIYARTQADADILQALTSTTVTVK